MTDGPGGETAETGDAADALSDLTLAELLAAAAEDLDGVTTDIDGAITTWSVSGHRFAVLAGDWVELRLAGPIARAALRTPDAAESPRGPEWVSFSPATLDDQAVDRAEAWFLSAYRLAVGTG